MIIRHVLQLLTQDVAPFGLLSAPLISWCGSAGLTIFFLWQITRLYQKSTLTAQPFARISRCLGPLAQERQHLDQDNLTTHPSGTLKNRHQETPPHLDRRDMKDLQLIDATFQREPWLAPAWKQYRKTLVTEQVAWYIEPRIFSSRSAQDLFSLETIFRGSLNLAWYQQVPSLLTGIGLLLTFIALLVGLSKLHADGHGIAGIQGLINGLAGKFLTSIVGLVCSTLFTLLEKPLMFRLLSAHQHCTHLIDDLFPRKTLEQILEGMTGTARRPHSTEQPSRFSGPMPYAQTAPDAFIQPLKAMTQSMDSLTREIRAHLLAEKTPSVRIPSETILEAFAPLIEQLTMALKQIPRKLEPHQAPRSSSTDQVNHLVDDLTARITHPTHPTLTRPLRQSEGWLQRLRSSASLLTPQSAGTHRASQTIREPQ
jgi:hypothetical protein